MENTTGPEGRRTGVYEEGFSIMRIVFVNVGLPREIPVVARSFAAGFSRAGCRPGAAEILPRQEPCPMLAR